MEKYVKLGDCVELIRDNIDPKFISKVPYIGLEHIEESSLHLNGFGYSTEVDSTKLKFKKGDILFGKLRPYFRKVIIAPFDGICSTDIWVARAKQGFDQKYIFYWMAGKDFVDFSMSGSEGTKMPRAKWEHVVKFERLYLDFSQQKKVGELLSTFDDKIELNRQMNQTLEAMARAIFKSWFVDFDPVYAKMEGRDYPLPPEIMDLFPYELEESELGLIPKGWKVVEINSLGEIITGKTPSTKNKNYYDKREIPFIKIPDMHNKLFITETNDYLSKSGADSQKNKYLPPKSICVSCIATPGLTAMTTSFSQTNQQINSIVPHEKELANFILLTMKRKGDEIQNRGSGGSVLHNLNKGDFEKLLVILPENKLIGTFENYLNPVFSKILNNQIMNSCLEEIRNRLLVNLINF